MMSGQHADISRWPHRGTGEQALGTGRRSRLPILPTGKEVRHSLQNVHERWRDSWF